MCGIFGSIGKPSLDKIKILATLNKQRGREALGLWNGKEIFRFAGDPLKGLKKLPKDFVSEDTSITLGHTRFGTHGVNNAENCHPFSFPHILGAHNGVIGNFAELQRIYKQNALQVDSQIIFYLLSQKGVEGLSEIYGSIALWWYDNRTPGKINLFRNEFNPLAMVETSKAIYFSSEASHLEVLEPQGVQEVEPHTLYSIDIESLVVSKEMLLGIPKTRYKTYNRHDPQYDYWGERYGDEITPNLGAPKTLSGPHKVRVTWNHEVHNSIRELSIDGIDNKPLIFCSTCQGYLKLYDLKYDDEELDYLCPQCHMGVHDAILTDPEEYIQMNLLAHCAIDEGENPPMAEEENNDFVEKEEEAVDSRRRSIR